MMITKRQTFRCLSTVPFLVVLSMTPAATLWASTQENTTQPPAPEIATLQSTYGKLPLSFEANRGQWDPSVQFVTRGKGHTLFLTSNEAVLSVRTSEATDRKRKNDLTQRTPLSTPSAQSNPVVRMTFAGADAQAEMVGLEPLPGIINYFIGDDPSKWHTNIPTYQKVEYKNLYGGIDLVYYGNQGQLEYDLVVAPGADPTQIMLAFDGADQIAVDEQGDLVLTLLHPETETVAEAVPTLRLQKPVVYQRDEQGEKHMLTGTYVLKPATAHPTVAVHSREIPQVMFQIASYDPSQPLIIDPVLSWATYLGGSDYDVGNAITVDAAGNAYVTGGTWSYGFPGTASNPIQSTLGGRLDVFVTKLNGTGTAIIYSTYLGGSELDTGEGITQDQAGNVYVTGFTRSSDFAGTMGNSIQSILRGGVDAFVTKLNPTGTSIVYSTYLGGRGSDRGEGIAVDVVGNAYVTGETRTPESDFPGTAGSLIQSTFGGFRGGSPYIWGDAFVTKLNAAGTSIVYSTYLGGSGDDKGFGIAVDQEGNAYVTGATNSSAFPGTQGGLIQSGYGGGEIDAFITKLNAAGTSIVYSTYLGGSGNDAVEAIAVDQAGQIYVTGRTGSSIFPGTASSLIQRTFGGGLDEFGQGGDAFVTKLNAAGTAILFSTYLGSSGADVGRGIALDAAGNSYVTGYTESFDFPGTTGNPIQSMLRGVVDAFVTKLNPIGTSIVYSTYLGGSSFDFGAGIAVDATGNVYVTGATISSGFPGTAHSTIQSGFGGDHDAFVAKITSSIPFAAFDARPKLDVHDRRPHGGGSHHRPYRDDAEGGNYQRQDDDEFKLEATFTLGGGSNGIDPLKEAVMIQVGTFSTSIPAGSFKQHKGRYIFEGRINGVHIEAVLRSLILGNDYELKVEGQGADLTGTKNPVTVSVTIGDDSGSKEITAKIK